MEPLRVGIVGVGNISGIYIENLSTFSETEIVAMADLDIDRAKAASAKVDGCQAMTPDELMASSGVELVLNLTVPKAHFAVAEAAVNAGKHVYNEKPLCATRVQGRKLMDLAAAKGVMVGGAPDTFYGAAHQTARRLIDEGAIGRPIAAQGYMFCRGHETWHPSPEFYYEQGGGPMLDMGPYYLTALVNMLGSVKRVAAITSRSFATRTITSEPKKGKVVPVEAYTHYAGVLEFANGAVGELGTSFDIQPHSMHPLCIYGEEGSLKVPDPNGYDGEVLLGKGSGWNFEPVKTDGWRPNGRGLGVRDMAIAARQGGPVRASGDLCLHVLDIMQAFVESSEEGRHIETTSCVERPAPFVWEG